MEVSGNLRLWDEEIVLHGNSGLDLRSSTTRAAYLRRRNGKNGDKGHGTGNVLCALKARTGWGIECRRKEKEMVA